MKVCILCGSIIPNGGTERAISTVSYIFDSIENVETHILSLCSSEEQSPSFNFKGSIAHLNLKPLKAKTFDKILWYLSAVHRIKKQIKAGDYDLIIAYGHNISVMLPFIKSKKEKIFAYEHINYDTIPKLFRKVISYIYPRLDGVIVLSEIAKKKLYNTNKNVIIIPNAIPFTSTIEFQNKLKFTKRVIMVGRVSSEKGYDRLIPIAEKLKYRFPDWTIDIYGDGPDLPKLKESLEEKGLMGYVICHGQVKDIQNQYPKGDILIMTSYTEALPMVIIEANYYGIPVVAYENEGTLSLVNNGKDGYIIKDDDVTSFVFHLQNLIEDYQAYKSMSNFAHMNALNYSIDSVRSEWILFFKQYLKK